MKCNNCGNEVQAGWKFCNYCGVKLVDFKTADGISLDALNICPNCGEKNPPGVVRCVGCNFSISRKGSMAAQEETSTDSAEKRFRDCPYCGERILRTAVKCKHCGEFLTERLRKNAWQAESRVKRDEVLRPMNRGLTMLGGLYLIAQGFGGCLWSASLGQDPEFSSLGSFLGLVGIISIGFGIWLLVRAQKYKTPS